MNGKNPVPLTIVGMSPDQVAEALKAARDDVQNKLNILQAKQQAYDNALRDAASAKEALDACIRNNAT